MGCAGPTDYYCFSHVSSSLSIPQAPYQSSLHFGNCCDSASFGFIVTPKTSQNHSNEGRLVSNVSRKASDGTVRHLYGMFIPSTTKGLKYLNPRGLRRVGSEMVLGSL